MINPIFIDTFVKAMEKLEMYNSDLDFGLPMINGKPTGELYAEILKYVDEYADQIEEMDANTYVMIICCLIAQKHMCKFKNWSSLEIYSQVLDSKFVNEKMLLYFTKIDEAFTYMGEAFSCRRKEYIEGFCAEYDFFQNMQDEEQWENFLNSIVEAIAICPQYEYAYCFLIVEYASMFMGTTFETDTVNDFSEYYYRAYQILDEETYSFLFSGEMECSYSLKKISDKYKDVRSEEELDEERRGQYHTDLNYYRSVNSHINYLADRRITDGCVSVNGKTYKLGIPFSKLLPTEERETYLAEYFEEEKTVNYKMGDEIFPYNIGFDKSIVYRDEEKTYRAMSLQKYRGFSFYMPKIECAPLRAIPHLTGLVVRNLTSIIMKRSQSELELQRENLSMQNQLNEIRCASTSDEDDDKIIEKMEAYYEEHKEEIGETRKRLFSKGLEQEFGKDTWSKMTTEVKQMLISAEISYESLSGIYGVDYSPAIIPLTKAVENILNMYVYRKGIYDFLTKHDLHDSKDYNKIYHWDKDKRKHCPNDSITMGQAEYMFARYETYANGMIKTIFMCHKDRERLAIVQQIRDLLKEVVKYRNEMAHMHGVGEKSMEICREKIVYAQISIIKNIYKLV